MTVISWVEYMWVHVAILGFETIMHEVKEFYMYIDYDIIAIANRMPNY